MADTQGPNAQQDPAEPPGEPSVDEQIDKLLDDVDSLTKEVLSDHDKARQDPAAATPTAEPQPTANDQGKTSDDDASAAGPQGPAAADKVVEDVDHELDHMEDIIRQMSGEARDANANPDPASEIPAEAQLAQAGPEPPSHPKSVDDEIASSIPTEPAQDLPPSGAEKELDADLDALLAPGKISPPAPPKPDEAKPKPDREKVSPSLSGSEAAAVDLTDDTLSTVSIWRLIRVKLMASLGRLGRPLGHYTSRIMLWPAEKIEDLVGHRLTPYTKELIGWCALATLLVSLITLAATMFA